MRAWSDSLAPPVYLPQDSLLRRGFPPDSLADSARTRLTASWTASTPIIDGDLGDWHLVRWNDLAGARSMVRGTWAGPDDVRLQFALAWCSEGLLLAGRLHDDVPTDPGTPARQQESIILSLASSSPVVQRYWMGGARALRVRVGGDLDAWTELRSRRPEPFAAAMLGARAAVRRDSSAAGSASTAFEILVPWRVLFPALPGAQSRLLCNVMAEDTDAGENKLAAWAARAAAGPKRSGTSPMRPTWSVLHLNGGPAGGTWFVSQSARHDEYGCEWAVASWGATPGRVPLELRLRDARGRTTSVHAVLPSAPALLHLTRLPAADSVWPSQRRFEVELREPGGALLQRSDLLTIPDPAALDTALAAFRADARTPAAVSFPSAADASVRVEKARARITGMGDWRARRFHATGILAWRSATWEQIEDWLEEAEIVRGLTVRAPDPEAQRRAAARWPLRGASGVPLGQVVLRGYRSSLDGSVQPYAVYASSRVQRGEAAPTLVALHDVDENESTLFEETSLRERIESRGWIALCPFGRGNTSFQGPGERDVLEALEQVRAALPVDGRRLYLAGIGMGGTGTWLVSLRHPQLFAAAGAISAYADMDQVDLFGVLGYQASEQVWFAAHNPVKLMRPDLTTVYRIAHGERDAVVSVVNARVADDRLTQLGLPHELAIEPTAEHGIGFFESQLGPGLDFLARHRRGEPGIANMERYAMSGGPVAGVFERGPFAVVYGTRELPAQPDTASASVLGPRADRRAAEQFAAEWRRSFAGQVPVLPDSAVSEAMLQNTNLVLVGDAQSNVLLARWAARLPVHYDPQGVELHDRAYLFFKYGIVFAAPNPDVPQRTLVVLSAMTNRFGAFRKSLLLLGADYALVSAGGVEAGDFGTAPGKP